MTWREVHYAGVMARGLLALGHGTQDMNPAISDLSGDADAVTVAYRKYEPLLRH
jgi:hypothetical protein